MKKLTVLLILVLTLVSVSSLTAAEPNDRFSDNEIENLIMGIKSGNDGLMRSSIYLAGKYKITNTTDALLEALEKESKPSNIILIALAIYQFGDSEAMMKIVDRANSSNDEHIKQMLTSIALQYLMQSDINYVFKH